MNTNRRATRAGQKFEGRSARTVTRAVRDTGAVAPVGGLQKDEGSGLKAQCLRHEDSERGWQMFCRSVEMVFAQDVKEALS